ncbi:MAG: hypothetical protein COB50_00155 [Thiotrichales bacterium]|nr:MAG: hypothetical protein COB50_00155 [Thiotrichales bacterium]
MGEIIVDEEIHIYQQMLDLDGVIKTLEEKGINCTKDEETALKQRTLERKELSDMLLEQEALESKDNTTHNKGDYPMRQEVEKKESKGTNQLSNYITSEIAAAFESGLTKAKKDDDFAKARNLLDNLKDVDAVKTPVKFFEEFVNAKLNSDNNLFFNNFYQQGRLAAEYKTGVIEKSEHETDHTYRAKLKTNLAELFQEYCDALEKHAAKIKKAQEEQSKKEKKEGEQKKNNSSNISLDSENQDEKHSKGALKNTSDLEIDAVHKSILKETEAKKNQIAQYLKYLYFAFAVFCTFMVYFSAVYGYEQCLAGGGSSLLSTNMIFFIAVCAGVTNSMLLLSIGGVAHKSGIFGKFLDHLKSEYSKLRKDTQSKIGKEKTKAWFKLVVYIACVAFFLVAAAFMAMGMASYLFAGLEDNAFIDGTFTGADWFKFMIVGSSLGILGLSMAYCIIKNLVPKVLKAIDKFSFTNLLKCVAAAAAFAPSLLAVIGVVSLTWLLASLAALGAFYLVGSIYAARKYLKDDPNKKDNAELSEDIKTKLLTIRGSENTKEAFEDESGKYVSFRTCKAGKLADQIKAFFTPEFSEHDLHYATLGKSGMYAQYVMKTIFTLACFLLMVGICYGAIMTLSNVAAFKMGPHCLDLMKWMITGSVIGIVVMEISFLINNASKLAASMAKIIVDGISYLLKCVAAPFVALFDHVTDMTNAFRGNEKAPTFLDHIRSQFPQNSAAVSKLALLVFALMMVILLTNAVSNGFLAKPTELMINRISAVLLSFVSCTPDIADFAINKTAVTSGVIALTVGLVGTALYFCNLPAVGHYLGANTVFAHSMLMMSWMPMLAFGLYLFLTKTEFGKSLINKPSVQDKNENEQIAGKSITDWVSANKANIVISIMTAVVLFALYSTAMFFPVLAVVALGVQTKGAVSRAKVRNGMEKCSNTLRDCVQNKLKKVSNDAQADEGNLVGQQAYLSGR